MKVSSICKVNAEWKDIPEWFKISKNHIGGHDAAAIMGDDPFNSPYTLYYKKMNQRLHDEKSPLKNANSEKRKWGKLLEDTIAKEFENETGLHFIKWGIVRDNLCDYRVAAVDRLNATKCMGLEIKTTSEYKLDDWANNRFPKAYYWQCLHYMLVYFCNEDGTLLNYLKGRDVCWYLVCLVGGWKLLYYKIDYVEADAIKLAEAEKTFMKRLKEGFTTPLNGSKYESEFIKSLNPTTETQLVLNNECDEISGELLRINEQIKALNKQKTFYVNTLMEKMKTSTNGISKNFIYKFQSRTPHEIISVKDVEACCPELLTQLRGYGVVKMSKESRVLSVKPRKD